MNMVSIAGLFPLPIAHEARRMARSHIGEEIRGGLGVLYD